MKKTILTVYAALILISCKKEEFTPIVVTPQPVVQQQNIVPQNSIEGDYQVISRLEYDTITTVAQYVQLNMIYPNCSVHNSYTDTAYYGAEADCSMIYYSDYIINSDSIFYGGALSGDKYTLSNDTLTIIHSSNTKIITTKQFKQ